MATTLAGSAERGDGSFYVRMAAACVLVGVLPFIPTFWWQLPAGTFIGPALLVWHGFLFTAWTLMLLSQTWLAVHGRLARHRAWGLAGISLATALVFMGLAVTVNSLNHGLAAGYGEQELRFSILPFSSIALFAAFFVCAIARRRDSEAHRRWMLLATVSLLQAAMGRVFFALMAGIGPGLRPGLGPPPPIAAGVVPSLLLLGFVAAGMVHDRRVHGRIHRVWWLGGAIFLAVIVLRVPLAGSAAWLGFARALAGIAG